MKHPGNLNILFCCPSFSQEVGGIQQYSRLLASALRSSPLTGNLSIVPLSANRHVLGGKPHFFADFARAVVRRPDLCFFTHIGLARVHPLADLLRVPFWICAHGIEFWNLRHRSEVRAIRHAHRILAVSRHTRDRLVDRLPDIAPNTCLFPNHVVSIPPAPTPAAEARKLLGLPTDGRILLTVSRLRDDRYKGHRQIFSAMNALGPDYGDVHYVIVGDGEDRAELELDARRQRLAHRVHFKGALDDRQRGLAYDACDAYVMPSTGEGFGIVFLEALAHGKPVLAGSVDGSVDALDDQPCGVLVNPRDPSSVAAGLAELLRGARDRNPLWSPERLREHVRARFGPARLQERVDGLLENFIAGRVSCAE